MKKIVLFAAAGLMSLAACQEKAGYIIKGTAEGVADGDTVFLQKQTEEGFEALDSVVVKNGTFEFKGTPDSVAVSRFVTYMKGDARIAAMVFVEKGNIQVNLSPMESRISGTPNNDTYQKFMDEYQKIGKEMNDMYQKIKGDTLLTEVQRDSLMEVLDKKETEGMDRIYQLVSENIASAAGVHLLTMFGSSFEVEKVQPLLEKIPAAFAGNEEVKALKEHVETVAKTAVGKKFIDFTLNTPEGKPVKLSDFIAANNYTLIDFWASWCGPCRMEMPNVVAAYAKYKAKGFGIVGVSLDNDVESWKKAIKDLNITWPQMSDLKGWQCEGAALYGVRAIPATLLVSKDGTIVARDLRGEDLEAKLAELMK